MPATRTLPLQPGTRLGACEIVSAIGAGGMGEVYRARDTKLNRDVAIKVLPESFAHDPDRLARFTREAHTLASLNHPGIAAIYGIEESGGVRALVMELVEGDDLSRWIARGAIPFDEVLPIAKQIAEALEAAHGQGIIHRDLKPANIKVRADGTVKVLDFGLAKAMDSAGGMPTVSQSPTITSPAMTQAGVILGTAAYMSPEQARGKTVDKRADIWAFACVLFEMLTGTRAFNGDDVTDILASVLKHEPAWRDLPTATPAHVRELLRWCLEKDPRQRLQSIGDARILLGRTAPDAPRPQPSRSWVAWCAAAVLAVVAMAGWLRGARDISEPPRTTLTIAVPLSAQMQSVGNQASAPEISPDGSAVMYRGRGGLYVRRLDSLEPKLVPGSDATGGAAFWSADSTTVVFPARGSMVKVRLPDGAPEVIAPMPGPTREGSWSDSGTILIAAFPLVMVPASGGETKTVEVRGLKKPGSLLNPEFLPGSDDFLFLVVPRDSIEESAVYLATLKDGKGVDPALLLKSPTAARYTPAGGGRLLFVRNDNLYSQKLNRTARKLEGEAELVVQGVSSQPGVGVGRADFSVARNGAVAWRPGEAAFSQVTMFDREGNQVGTTGPPGSINSLFLSPDETRILAVGDQAWLLDVGQPGRQTLPADANWSGWFRDGSKVLGSRPGGSLVEFSANGSGEIKELGPVAPRSILHDVSPDEKQVLSMVGGGRGIFVTRLDGTEEERRTRAFVQSDEPTIDPRFSPDGRWIVYSAGGGLFVQPFPGPGRRQPVAPQGQDPEWRKDGKEIAYVGRGGVMAVAVDATGSQLRFGAPRNLFLGLRTPAGSNASARPLAVSRDGSRFYWPQAVEQPDSNVIHIKTGWAK